MKDVFKKLLFDIEVEIKAFFEKLLFIIQSWGWEEWMMITISLLIAFLIGFGIGKL